MLFQVLLASGRKGTVTENKAFLLGALILRMLSVEACLHGAESCVFLVPGEEPIYMTTCDIWSINPL